MPRLLVVTAVAAEAEAVLRGLDGAAGSVGGRDIRRALTGAGLLDVLAGGVGPVEAALSAAAALSGAPYDLVLSAGIAGGFGAYPLAVATAVSFADLGSQLADDGFSPVGELGFGTSTIDTDEALSAELARRTGAVAGTVLTVATVTGTSARAAQLRQRFPGAVAEGMEGFGVASAAHRAGVRFGELRAISNPVGPRDRDRWQVGPALDRLGTAFQALLAEGAL